MQGEGRVIWLLLQLFNGRMILDTKMFSQKRIHIYQQTCTPSVYKYTHTYIYICSLNAYVQKSKPGTAAFETAIKGAKKAQK